jgi:hypothetical protein
MQLIHHALLAACLIPMAGCSASSRLGPEQSPAGADSGTVEVRRLSCDVIVAAELAVPHSIIAVATDGLCVASFDRDAGEVLVGGLHSTSCVVVARLADGRELTATVQFSAEGESDCPFSATDASAFEGVDAGADH